MINLQNTSMKKEKIIAAAAVATAGVATYLICKKLLSRRKNNVNHSSPDNNRHLTDVFPEAKSPSK